LWAVHEQGPFVTQGAQECVEVYVRFAGRTPHVDDIRMPRRRGM